MGTEKKSLREEIGYRSGLHFSLKPGAPYVCDGKYGDQDPIMEQSESDVTQDVRFPAEKESDRQFEPDLTFRDIVLFYKNYLMRKQLWQRPII